MTKDEAIRYYANSYDTTLTESKQILNNFSAFIEDVVAMGEELTLPGVMTVGVKETKPRKGYNFQTGETVMYDSKLVPYVKIGAKLKRAAAGAPMNK